MICSYMRVSTAAPKKAIKGGKETKPMQTTDRQRITLEEYSEKNNFTIDKFVEERISGAVKSENREVYRDLKEKTLRKDDVLIVTDLDRLGRDADDVIAELKDLKKRGIIIVALDIPYMNDWKMMIGKDEKNNNRMYAMVIDIVITLKAHMAEQEREKIAERVTQGVKAYREKNKDKHWGRPVLVLSNSFIKEYEKFLNGDYGKMKLVQFAKTQGIARSTLYKYISLYNKQKR